MFRGTRANDRLCDWYSGPFRAGLKDRTFNGHICRIAEGEFGGFFGWPNLTLTPDGFMGLPASKTPGDMRVIDIYRREGEKLSENWIFIDLLHFFKQLNVDILNNLEKIIWLNFCNLVLKLHIMLLFQFDFRLICLFEFQ